MIISPYRSVVLKPHGNLINLLWLGRGILRRNASFHEVEAGNNRLVYHAVPRRFSVPVHANWNLILCVSVLNLYVVLVPLVVWGILVLDIIDNAFHVFIQRWKLYFAIHFLVDDRERAFMRNGPSGHFQSITAYLDRVDWEDVWNVIDFLL